MRGCCCTSLPHNYRKSYPVLLTRTECSLTRLTSTLCLTRDILFLFLFGQLDRNVSKGTNLIKNIYRDFPPGEIVHQNQIVYRRALLPYVSVYPGRHRSVPDAWRAQLKGPLVLPVYALDRHAYSHIARRSWPYHILGIKSPMQVCLKKYNRALRRQQLSVYLYSKSAGIETILLSILLGFA